MNSYTFGVLTDTHCGSSASGGRPRNLSLAKMQEAIDCFNGHELPMLLTLGDLIDETNPADEEQTYAAVQSVLNGFSGEHFSALGNHDVQISSKQDAVAREGFPGNMPFYSFDRGDLHFVVLDANHHEDGSDFSQGNFQWENAWISEDQILWLKDDLNSSPAPAIVCCHETLNHVVDPDGILDPHVVKNADRVRQILESSGKVIAVLLGHYHPGMMASHNNIPYISLRAMVLGDTPQDNAYSMVTIKEGRHLRVKGFGTQPSLDDDQIQKLTQDSDSGN